jgi:3-oxoacyl-[acyl-carrier protein] reductase
MKLNGQIAVVTGASRGIGRAVAFALASEGATVILAARTASDLKAAVKAIEKAGGKAEAVIADCAQEGDIARLFSNVKSTYGRLDILVNNAGIGRFAPVRQLQMQDLDDMWNLNLRGVVLCTQHALKSMEEQKSGTIVNIDSLAGKNAFVNGGGYAATKWALLGFSRCLMLEVREFNIRVVTICPGSVETAFSPRTTDAAKQDWILQPEDVASAVIGAVTMPGRAMVSEIDIRPTPPR